MTPAERTARKAYRKELPKALTAVAKPAGFTTSGGCLYGDPGGWFLAVGVLLDPGEMRTRLVAHIKPMTIDPIFWDAMGLGDEWRRPLAKRHLGLALRDPPFAQLDLDDGNEAVTTAARIVQEAEEWRQAAGRMTLGDFLDRCRKAEKRPFQYFGCIATTLIAMGDVEAALKLCRDASAAGHNGGYRQGKAAFVDLLAAMIAPAA